MSKIGDYIRIKHGYPFNGAGITTEDNNVVLVTPGNFRIGGGFKEDKCKFFSDEYPEEYILHEDDLIVTMTDLSKAIDTLGYSALVPKSSRRYYLHNQRIGLVQFNNGEINKHYLYWFMRTPKYQKTIAATSSGSTVHHTSPDRICEVEIDVPEMDVQIRIASFLDQIEEKININNQINRNLSELAQAMFKSWFIDLEPFGGVTPDNWTTGVLKDVLQLRKDGIKAGENTELPYLPIDVIPMNDLSIKEVKANEEAQSSLITFNKDDILIGAMRVYFHRVVIAPFDGITRSTCFVLRPYDEEYLSFGLLCCNQNSSIDYAQATSKGSTMPYAVWKNGLGDMEITIPDRDTAYEFNEVIKPMLAVIQKSFYEVNRLQELRDRLLPKLMSGELDVSDLDI